MLLQTDSLGFLLGGLAVGLIAEYFRKVEINGELVLVGLTTVGFAALAVALTALTIFVSFVDDTYLRILTMSSKGGLSGYIGPYLAAALVSTTTTTLGVISAIVYGALPSPWEQATALGLESGFVIWSAWAVFQLVIEISIHGLNRYELQAEEDKSPDVSDIFKRERERSKRKETPPPTS
jgi:hypothetical protein